MRDQYTKPYLFDQSDTVIDEYLIAAQTKLEKMSRIPLLDEPIEDSKHYDLVCEVANEMWLDNILTDR